MTATLAEEKRVVIASALQLKVFNGFFLFFLMGAACLYVFMCVVCAYARTRVLVAAATGFTS